MIINRMGAEFEYEGVVYKIGEPMPGATWRDVVAAVLEQYHEPVALAFLYEKIEPHKKAQANKWWKEKIRQTLQINPAHFVHDGRGMWSLKRSAA